MENTELFTVNIEFKITKQMIQDLLVCAFEGGSNYWYSQLEPLAETSKKEHPSDSFYDNLVTNGFNLYDNEGGKHHKVTPGAFKIAMQIMRDKYPSHLADVQKENMDAATGDVFLQLAIFGDIIYG